MNLSNFNLKFEDAKEFTVFGEEVQCDEIKVTIKNEANKFVQELYLLSILLKGEEIKQVVGGKRLIILSSPANSLARLVKTFFVFLKAALTMLSIVPVSLRLCVSPFENNGTALTLSAHYWKGYF